MFINISCRAAASLFFVPLPALRLSRRFFFADTEILPELPHFSLIQPSPGAYTFISGNSLRGVLFLKGNIEERACDLALYIIETKATVRAAAKQFGISKSTVHKDLAERLPAFNRPLYLQVKEILEENKAERHIRGGIATRRKYKGV
jgi:putative DeoR family transcriptional regulator (stage III sporulation protein D)